MYERILAPLDGSDVGELMLPYVEELSDRLGLEAIMLHVCPPQLSSFSHKHDIYIEQVAQAVKTRMKGRGLVRPMLVAGNPNKEIVNCASHESIDIIAMMSRGQTGMKRKVIGSTADKVIRETNKPVLLIKPESPPAVREKGILSKILVPLDGSNISEVALSCVQELGSSTSDGKKLQVTLLRIIPSDHYVVEGEAVVPRVPYREEEIEQLKIKAKSYLEEAGKGLSDNGVEMKYAVGVGKAEEEIISFADSHDINLIAISTHGYSGFNRLFLGSVAERVMHETTTPLLLVKPE
jgi:nucleotide-binding universal stress UspA family protein